MSNPALPIRDLSTWLSRWRIEGRVIDKSDTTTFRRNDGREGKIGSVDIVDQKGDSIRAKFWDDAATKWMSTLQKGKVYSFANGRVGVATRRRFSNLTSNYEITFSETAEIAELDDKSDIAQARKSQFVTLREIKNTSRELPFTVDLCGRITRAAPAAEEFTAKNTGAPSIRRPISLADDSGCEIEITLFGDIARNKCVAVGNIVEIQSVQIREFRGRRGATMRGSQIIAAPQSAEALRVKKFFDEQGENVSLEPLSDQNASSGGIGGVVGSTNDVITLQQLFQHLENAEVSSQDPYSQNPNDASNGEFFTLVAEPCKILYSTRNGDVALSYPGCGKCNKKMTLTGENEFRCEMCDITTKNSSPRMEKADGKFFIDGIPMLLKTYLDLLQFLTGSIDYASVRVSCIRVLLFGVLLADASGTRLLARCFHQPGRVLLGQDVDIDRLVPYSSTLSTLQPEASQLLEYDALWKKFRFRVRARKELFGGEERHNVAILTCEPLNYPRAARLIVNELKTNLGERKRSSVSADGREDVLMKKSRHDLELGAQI